MKNDLRFMKAIKYSIFAFIQIFLLFIFFWLGAVMYASKVTRARLRADIILGLRAHNAISKAEYDDAANIIGIQLVGKKRSLLSLQNSPFNILLIRNEADFSKSMSPFFDQIDQIETSVRQFE